VPDATWQKPALLLLPLQVVGVVGAEFPLLTSLQPHSFCVHTAGPVVISPSLTEPAVAVEETPLI
jgi:hypothetical protein